MLEGGVEESAIESFATIADALYAARLSAEDEPAAPVRIIIFGSFVTVGQALEVFARKDCAGDHRRPRSLKFLREPVRVCTRKRRFAEMVYLSVDKSSISN